MSSLIERLAQGEVRTADVSVSDRSIGRILLDAGKLKPGDAERALKHQKEKGVRFGEACVQLKLVSETDIESALSRQFDYPYLRTGEKSLSTELAAAYFPFSRQVEALRALRTQLLLRWFTPERRILAVISPARGDGRTYLTANLAIVFSQLGEKTLVIDADLRNPRQHELFKLSNQYGLSAMIAGRAEAAAVERVKGFSNLSVIPAGAVPPNPLELLSRREFSEILTREAESYDVVLLDTPPAGQFADAQAVAARAAGALIVGKQDKSRWDALARLVESIQSTSAEVVGSVLNR